MSNSVPDPSATNSNIDIDTFNSNFNTKIARFELYPSDEPTAYVVGFSVTNKNNNKSIYRDTQVLLTSVSGQTDDQVVAVAWDSMKASFQTWAADVMSKPSIQNGPYVPTSF